MRLLAAVWFSVCIFLLSACKKEDENAFIGIRIKTLTDEGSGFSSTFNYDGNGRVASIHSNNNADDIFTYSANCANEHYTHSASNTDWTVCHELNPQGYSQGSFGDDNFYDTDGYLIEIYHNDSLSPSITAFTITSGNVTLKKDSSIGAPSSNNIFYEYDLGKLNTTGNENYGMVYNGKSSTNLVSRELTVNHYGDTVAVNPHTYNFDGMNRVVSRKTFNNLGGLIEHLTYTYY